MKLATPARVVRLLRDRLAATGDAGRTITLDALVHEVLPYPVARAALGLAGKAEYDLALLRLLENRTYLQVDPAVVDAVSEELERLEPGLDFVDEWSDSLLRLRRIDLGPLEEEDDEGPGPPAAAITDAADVPDLADAEDLADAAGSSDDVAGEAEAGKATSVGRPKTDPAAGRRPTEVAVPDPRPPVTPPVPGDDAPADEAEVVESVPEAAAPTRCWSCGGRLPAREAVLYCPQCGTGQRDRRCSACGDRVEPDWRFCVRCGRGLAHP